MRYFLFAILIATPAAAQDAPVFSTGPAETINPGLVTCSGNGSRISAVGQVVDEAGVLRTVPAEVYFDSAPLAYDLYNECGGQTLQSSTELNLENVPVMDAGGEETFTAYIFADNYFELYVNGTLVAVDPVVFTPFNSNVVRFRADRPVSVAIMGVDWEENLGLGSEDNRGRAYHPGDGGFVAQFQDESGATIAITDETWRAQTFYTAPIADRACLVLQGPVRDSSACSTEGVDDGSGYSAAYWDIPSDWMLSTFDDSDWPAAVTFTNDIVGVDNKRAFTNFIDLFDAPDADAQFIWTSNLVLDNLILMRTTIE